MNCWNCSRKAAIAILLALFFPAAAYTGDLLTPELESLRTAGFSALFNMQYEEAKKQFEEMERVAPDEPAGPIYLANAIWLGHLASLRRLQTNVYNRNNSFFDEKANDAVDPGVDAEFSKHIQRGMNLAEKRLKADKKDREGLYYLGIAKNISAGYEATVKRSFFAALRNGSKGVGLHRDLTKIDPSIKDAYLSVGMYEYVVGSLPLAVKILVFFGGVHGSKSEGLRMLEDVAKNGNYARDEARTLLVMLYNREKRIEDALKVLDELTASYPGNSLFRLERAMTLAQLSQLKASSEAFDALMNDEAAMKYMPDLIHYQYAEALASGRLWNRAHEQYMAAYESEGAPAGLKTMAHLGAGKCLDAQGQRQAALIEYNTVLKRKKAFDAQDQASDYIKNPYSPP